MIKQIKLRNFKAFENFTIILKESSLLVGPNSAGKKHNSILTQIRRSVLAVRAVVQKGPNAYLAQRASRS